MSAPDDEAVIALANAMEPSLFGRGVERLYRDGDGQRRYNEAVARARRILEAREAARVSTGQGQRLTKGQLVERMAAAILPSWFDPERVRTSNKSWLESNQTHARDMARRCLRAIDEAGLKIVRKDSEVS